MSGYYIKPKIVVESLTAQVLESFDLGKEVLVLVSNTVKNQFKLSELFKEIEGQRNLYVYSHIQPDAHFEDLDRILNDVGNKKISIILAIGGGSVIDAAKALSISFSGVSYKDVFYGRAKTPNDKVKVLAVPTTAGTGAELSFGAILYDSANKIKGGVRGEIVQPDYVVIDAQLHNACPFKLKAEVGFDCLTHAVETYISKKSSPLVRNQSISCIHNIFDHLEQSCKQGSLYDMEKIAISSALMGINLAYSSTCLPHRIQYVIGPLTGTSHAAGLIAIYKGWIQHLIQSETEAFEQLSKDLGMEKLQLADKIKSLKASLNIDYSLTDLGVKPDQIEEIAHSVSGSVQSDPSYKDVNSIIQILKFSI